MAKFNPDVKEIKEPNYLGYSRGISQPESDKSAAYIGAAKGYEGAAKAYAGQGDAYAGAAKAYEGSAKGYEGAAKGYQAAGEGAAYAAVGQMAEGAGELLKQTATLGDTLIKQEVDNNVVPVVEKMRDDEISRLEALKAGTGQTQRTGELSGSVSTGSLAGGAENDTLPHEVEGVGSNLERLYSARVNGKLSESDYLGKLNTYAKSIRNRFPGYRDYIDHKFSNIVGGDPANMYKRSLTADINAAAVLAGSGKDKVRNLGYSNLEVTGPGGMGMETMIRRYEAGQDSGDVILGAVAAYKRTKSDIELDGIDLARGKARGELDDARIERSGHAVASVVANKYIDGIIGNGGASTPQITQALADQAAGKVKPMTSTEADQLAPQVQAIRVEAGLAMRRALEQPISASDKRSRAEIMGPDKVNKVIEANMKPIDEIMKSIVDRDFGAAHASARAFKAVTDTTTEILVKDPQARGFFALTAAGRQIGGDFWVPELSRQMLGLKMDEKLKHMAEYLNLQLGVQPDINRTGVPFTQKSAVEQVLAASQIQGHVQAQMNQTIINRVQDLTKRQVTDPVKINIVQSAYTPGNVGITDKFPTEAPDPNNPGRTVPGKFGAWLTLTGPAVMAETMRLSNTYDPKIKENLQNFAGSEFGRLLRDEFKNMADVKVIPTYNDKTHQFDRTANPYVNGVVQRLNWGLTGLTNVSAATGSNPNADVLNLMSSLHAPKPFLDAIAATLKPKVTP